MASEDEDLLDDSNFKDLGELEDLDDDAENALLGDSDEEGSSRQRERAITLMSSSRNQQQLYSGDETEETEDVEEDQEQEFEYVDEEGNPVEIGYNDDDVEYVEVSQDDADHSRLDESANEFVLDLEVDADLEFDESGALDASYGSVASTKNIQHTKPKTKSSVPTTVQTPQQKEDKRKQLQQQKPESHKHQNQRQQQEANRRQQLQREQQSKREQQQQKQQEMQIKEQQEQQRIHKQKAPQQQKQQLMSIRSSSIENEKSMEDHGFKHDESINSAVDNEEEQQYKTSIKNETSDSEDEEESGRGRFRTERSNVISVTTAKKRSNIPDSLEAVISHEEAARLERSNRQQSKRPWQRGGSARDMPRDRERDRNRDRDREKARNRDHDRNYKDSPLLPRHQEIGHNNLAQFQQLSDSAPPSLQDSDSSTNSEHKATRKILINPHFKGSIGPATEALTKTNYSWDNHASAGVNLGPSDHSSIGSSDFHYIPPQSSEGHFGPSFGTQASNNLLNQPNTSQNSLGQYHFAQPPPIKHSASFHVPPPTMPDFQNRPPPLMSIPPLIPPTNNHMNAPVNLFPPSREPPTSRLTFENKAHELSQGQFQTGNDPWARNTNQHNFKPYNVPPPHQGFPSIPQNAEQPPPNFPNVHQPPPPIQRTEFPHQLVPPAGPLPPFNRPPPGFDVGLRLGGPPPSRPMLTNWNTQQQQPPPPMLLPVFNRPPPPVNIAGHQNNFQVTSLPPVAPPQIRPVHSSVSENLGNINRLSPPRIHLRQPFSPSVQSSNLRSLLQQPQQHKKQQQQQQHQKQQQSWSPSNLRPIAQQKQPLFGKRPNNEAISASPLKQIRITNQQLKTGRSIPKVNTNIRQVEIVDKLPAIASTFPQGPNRIRDSSQQASNTLENSDQKGNSEAIEEDEETRRYRQQIELQKKKREEVLRRKEQRRALMAHERRKQMLLQQQHPSQEAEPTLELSDAQMLSPIEITSTKQSISANDDNQMTSSQSAFDSSPDNAQAESAKKRVVYFRRVVTRPFSNLRRPTGIVGSPIRTVTNAGGQSNPAAFPPHLQMEQKRLMQRLPLQLQSQEVVTNVKAKIVTPLKRSPQQQWMQMNAFNSNSNLTNITIQRPTKNQSHNTAGIQLTQNVPSLTQAPQQAIQPLQHPGRPSVQLRKPTQPPARPLQERQNPQQSGTAPQQPVQPLFHLLRRSNVQMGIPHSLGRPFHRDARQVQFGVPQQQVGRSNQQQLSNVINKPVAKVLVTSQSDANRPCQMMTTEVGVVNVSPDVKLRTTNTGIPNRVVINANKRALPAGSAQLLAKRTSIQAVDAPPSVAAVKCETAASQQPQQVLTVNCTGKVQIENLAQATSDVQLRKLCQSIGPVESINLFKDQRRALVKFKNGLHAKQFMDKYQRRMVDLSLIAISLVS